MVIRLAAAGLAAALLLGFPRGSAAVEPPPGVGQWKSAILATQEDTLAVSRAHLEAMAFVDGQVLSAELALVCRAVELAARDAATRSKVRSDTAAGRMRSAFLPLVAQRLKSRRLCLPGQPAPEVGPGVDLAQRVHEAVGLLALDREELNAVGYALDREEQRDGDVETAVLEMGDWSSRHDTLVRRLAAMNLAIRHVHHGQVASAADRAFGKLRELLEREDG